MRFIVLGTTEFTQNCAQALLDCGQEVCVIVSLPREMRPHNSADLKNFSKKNFIHYLEVDDINSTESIAFLHRWSADYIISSWPKILNRKVLKIAKQYCIGTHPTTLPYNRGRHPLHWLIVLGARETRLSFFKMEEGIDTGNILLQMPIKIYVQDEIGALVDRVNKAGYLGMKNLCKKLLKNFSFRGKNQNHCVTNYWRKRTPHDVTLDTRMTGETILRIVRSFSRPYPCANLIFENYLLKVTAARIVRNLYGADTLRRLEHGKILKANKNKIQIKVEGDIVELTSKDPLPLALRKADYIYPPTKYMERWGKDLINA